MIDAKVYVAAALELHSSGKGSLGFVGSTIQKGSIHRSHHSQRSVPQKQSNSPKRKWLDRQEYSLQNSTRRDEVCHEPLSARVEIRIPDSTHGRRRMHDPSIPRVDRNM